MKNMNMNKPRNRNRRRRKQQPPRSQQTQQTSPEQPGTAKWTLEDSAAVKIQKVFRGFMVRKNVKKIASIRNDVSEIERRIGDKEAVSLIRRDAKESLRVNETIMSLLLKLDSILGVDGGVRELRKAATRKAIALQDKVDSIATN